MMESTTMQNIEREAAARSMVTLANSTGKKRYTPKTTSLLTFLRNDTIGHLTSLLEAKGKPTLNTTGTLRLAKRT